MRPREGGVVPEEQCILVTRHLLSFMNHFVVSRDSMSSSSSSMVDPAVWGNLQFLFNLENVYLRIPLVEFFQLCGVCKIGIAWHANDDASLNPSTSPSFYL
jgi:hypothetical protein